MTQLGDIEMIDVGLESINLLFWPPFPVPRPTSYLEIRSKGRGLKRREKG